MFNLEKIKFIKTDEDRKNRNGKNYSFVGLQKTNIEGYEAEFWLPLGFDNFETDVTNPTSFDSVKNFFFKMYRTFQTYKVRKLNQLTEEEKTKNRDGVFEFENGFSFVNENNEQIVFYGKLNALDKILEGYDELRISSLEKKQVRSHEIDYSKIHKYMHQAIYLDDDVIYLDEMNIAKSVLIQDSPLIIQLFCFIYTEIKKELEELDNVADKAFELADLFKDNYLQPNSSLFAQDTFVDTINILKNVFEEIDSKTTYKDEDFWHFYEAIEAFLMGERLEDDKGIYFGISNFYDVWEDICQAYMLEPENSYRPQVLFADVKGKLVTRRDLGLEPELKVNPFKIKINRGFKARMLKPDLVLYEDYIRNLDGKLDIYSIQIKDYINYKVNFSLDFKRCYPDIHSIYLKYLKLNTKYLLSPSIENEWITSFHKDKFLSEITELLDNLHLIDHINRNSIVLDNYLIQIIDYKYMRQSDYQLYNPNAINEKGENKIKEDIHKQLIYEWTVQQNFTNSETISEFWIPYYSDEELEFKKPITDTSSDFKKSQIEVYKINFKILQENYVKLSKTL